MSCSKGGTAITAIMEETKLKPELFTDTAYYQSPA